MKSAKCKMAWQRLCCGSLAHFAFKAEKTFFLTGELAHPFCIFHFAFCIAVPTFTTTCAPSMVIMQAWTHLRLRLRVAAG
jgi:hypothetical protein